MRHRILFSALLVVLAATVFTAQRPTWESATELYLAGRADDALDMIARLSHDEIRNGGREALGKFNDRRRSQALVALWTEVFVEIYEGFQSDPRKHPEPWWPDVCCRWSGIVLAENGGSMNGKKVLSNPKGTLIAVVQQYRKASPEFLEAWYVFALAHKSWDYYDRDDCLGFAPSAVKKTPEMLLALARHEENAWYFVRESNWPLRIPADLGRAKNALLDAQKAQPTLDEARLRLGHVYAVMGDDEKALAELGTVVAPMNPKFVYLARLFEAQIYQYKGDLSRAQQAYEQALKAYRAQSAEIGLARIMFMRGRRSDAKASLLEWVTDSGTPPQDPWAEYYYGFEGQLDRYRDRLRAAVLADDGN